MDETPDLIPQLIQNYQTSFETCTVVANWDEANAFSIGEHTLPPLGVLVASADGSLTAGVFTDYNGTLLSAGDHYLIENRGLDEIIVHQPIGADTNLTSELLPGWGPNDPIEARAYAANGQVIESVPVTVTAQGITFVYQQRIAEQSVAYYKVIGPSKIFLPLILKRYS